MRRKREFGARKHTFVTEEGIESIPLVEETILYLGKFESFTWRLVQENKEVFIDSRVYILNEQGKLFPTRNGKRYPLSKFEQFSSLIVKIRKMLRDNALIG